MLFNLNNSKQDRLITNPKFFGIRQYLGRYTYAVNYITLHNIMS